MDLTLNRRQKAKLFDGGPTGKADSQSIVRRRQVIVPALVMMLVISLIAERIDTRRDLHERALSHPLA
jgi:hypothetical protein